MRLSWTRYNSFQSCKLQYALRYVHRVKGRPARLSFLVGSVVHRLMLDWSKAGFGDDWGREEVASVFTGYARGLPLSGERQAELLEASARGFLKAKEVYQRLGLISRGARLEYSFLVEFPGASGDFLTGHIDVLDPSGVIFDLKMYTEENQASGFRPVVSTPLNLKLSTGLLRHGSVQALRPSSVQATRATQGLGQLYTYGAALSLLGERIRYVGFITPFLQKKVRIFPVGPQDYEEHLGSLGQALAEMGRPVPEVPTVGGHCYFCEFYKSKACPATWSGGEDFDPAGSKKPGNALVSPEKMYALGRKMSRGLWSKAL